MNTEKEFIALGDSLNNHLPDGFNVSYTGGSFIGEHCFKSKQRVLCVKKEITSLHITLLRLRDYDFDMQKLSDFVLTMYRNVGR